MKEMKASQPAGVATDRKARKVLLIDDLYHPCSHLVKDAIRIKRSLEDLSYHATLCAVVSVRLSPLVPAFAVQSS
jgi:hypothetical protein